MCNWTDAFHLSPHVDAVVREICLTCGFATNSSPFRHDVW